MSVWIWVVLFDNIFCVCVCVCVCVCMQYFCHGIYLVLVILIEWSDYLIAWWVKNTAVYTSILPGQIT